MSSKKPRDAAYATGVGWARAGVGKRGGGRVVYTARLKSGLSQAQFAAALRISPRTLQQWEQGRRQPSGAAETLLKIVARHPEVLRGVMAA